MHVSMLPGLPQSRAGHAGLVRSIDRKPGRSLKVLIATSASLSRAGIGELYLGDMIAALPDISFEVAIERPFLMGGGRKRSRLLELVPAVLARFSLFQRFRLTVFKRFFLDRRAAALAAMADDAGADRICLTASSAELIWIGERLVAAGRDVRVIVWDPPDYLARNLRLSTSLSGELQRSFGALLGKVRSLAVISRAMQALYRERYGVDSEVIRHGIDTTIVPAARATARQPVRIVFAGGTLHPKSEWNRFIDALTWAGWQIDGQPVKLFFLGRFPLTGARKPREVTYFGKRPYLEALQILSTMDIGYLPYWFDERYAEVARNSFSSKLSAYAVAGLAVLHHAPNYTEATNFLQEYPFGLSCASNEPGDLIETLRRLLKLAPSEACASARRAAIREELSRDATTPRFRRFLADSHPV